MDLLEHPFEAVAFRLYSLPDASAATGAAAWTCLAAILAAAAAAGLWRLRSSAPTTASTGATKPLKLDLLPAKEAPTAPPSASDRWSEPAAGPTAPSPKERYTAYYRDTGRVGCCDVDGDDDDREDDAEEHEDDGVYQTPSETTMDPFGGWEEVVVRTLPLSPTAAGRYRSPTAALGGVSVVQLWGQATGDGLTPTASPRRRGRVVATVRGF